MQQQTFKAFAGAAYALVWEGSTERVLVMEHVGGVSVGGSVIDGLSQRDRDDVSQIVSAF